jgi:anaerobic magnesium-protoporphyrin IX monomethyl ester cyclase
MKVCLINPQRLLAKGVIALPSSPPLGLAFIAGALRNNGNEIQIIDCIAENSESIRIFNNNPDVIEHGITKEEVLNLIDDDVKLIGISCMFTNNWLSTRELIDYIGSHLPNVPIIIGGEHATAAPELSLSQTKHLLACVLGEGEETIVEIANAIENHHSLSTIEGIAYKEDGEIFKTIKRNRIRNLDSISNPYWDPFPLEKYFNENFSYGVSVEKSLPVMASRGCPYECTFCSSPQMWGTRYFLRTPQNFFDEIKDLNIRYGVTNFDFYDLTAIISKKWIVEFAKLLIESNLNITWQIPSGTRTEVIDREVASYLYQSGCINITYAPESGSERILKLIKKKVKPDKMLQSINGAYKEKLIIKLNMIMGFPGETHKDIFKTFWFLIKCSYYGAHDMIPSIFSPYPGSELFDDLVKSGKIDVNNDTYLYNIIFAESYTHKFGYNDLMSGKVVRMYSILAMIIFYASSFIFRPWRVPVSIYNILTKNYKTRTEYGVYNFAKKLLKEKNKNQLELPLNTSVSKE